MTGKTIEELKVGDFEEFSKTVSEYDIYSFAGITGDFNPAHINDDYSKKSVFKERIAHGMLSAGFISAILGTKLPGPGTIYLQQELNFTAPVKIGDTITARVEIIELITEKNKVISKTICKNQKGEKVLDGRAVVLAPLKKQNF